MTVEANDCWRPLLTGATADLAAAWSRRCADALADPDWVRFAPAYEHLFDPDTRSARAASLSGGCAGAALLLRRLGRETDAAALLARAIETLGDVAMNAGLLKGFTGIAWTVAHLAAVGADGDDGDPLAEIDDALGELLASGGASHHDLGDGLAGIGMYFLERLPRPGAARALDDIVERLTALAVAGPAGGDPGAERITWRARARPQVNLGLAHGVAGVIAFLARVVAVSSAAPEAAARARPLLERAVAWLLAQRWSASRSCFPGAVDAEHGAIAARDGWCEGDLGIATALSMAGRTLGHDDWSREARATARHAARRSANAGGVDEPGLCHGAAGIAHMFNRLYQETGDSLCRVAAARWFERTLSLEQPGRGVAGVLVWRDAGDGTARWVASPGLLMGAVGVALALDASRTDVAPTWDRALGLSG